MSQSSLSSIVRGVAAMDISQEEIKPKPFIPGHKPTQSQAGQMTISRQNSVSKLLTKYAKPHPFQPAPSSQSNAVRMALASQAQAHQSGRPFAPSTAANQPHVPPINGPPSPSKEAKVAAGTFDIGRYDGGFETETEEGRGQVVFGEAAKDLALDSSQA